MPKPLSARDFADVDSRIYAVVVTYNRPTQLSQCLKTLARQSLRITKILVIDNAGQFPVSVPEEAHALVEVIRLSENTGSAGGFAHGLYAAYSQGAEWIWLLDDDCEAHNDALDALWRHTDRYHVLNSLVRSNSRPEALAFSLVLPGWPNKHIRRLDSATKHAHGGLFPWICPFNGTLIHRSVVTEVGVPRAELFIWGDEVEFFLRLGRRFECITVLASHLFHPESDGSPNTMPAWKFFYRIRNQIYISSRYGTFRVLRVVKNTLVLFFARPRSVTVRLFVIAIRDGLLGRLGATLRPHAAPTPR